MFIRTDSRGEIITIAAYDDPLSEDDIFVPDESFPSDFKTYNTYKYQFIDGAFVVKSGFVEPIQTEPTPEEEEANLKRHWAAYGVTYPQPPVSPPSPIEDEE